MKLGIIMNTNDPETAWNALRLANETLSTGNKVSMFLLGSGVEITNIRDITFDIAGVLEKFLNSGGNLLSCGYLSRIKTPGGWCMPCFNHVGVGRDDC